jgi:aminoglycoside phosphotransferase (APT) family kinase protein
MEDYWVWDVLTRRPTLHLIIKLAGPRAALTSAFERTAALHRLLREKTSVPVPEIVAASEQYRKWPWRYFIKTYLPGIEWAEVAGRVQADELRAARAQLGAAVAELHQVRFPAYGELDNQAVVTSPLPYPEALAQRVRRMVANPQAQAYLLAMLAQRGALFEGLHDPSVCHEDLHHYNLLLEKQDGAWKLSAVLDFEKAWAGDHEIDLARMDLWHMTLDPFWNAYREHGAVDPGYAQRKALYQLIWCVEFAQDTDIQIEITQSLCRALALPIIESFEPFRLKT